MEEQTTQVMPSQVYRTYYAAVDKPSAENSLSNDTRHTYDAGDTGYCELPLAFDTETASKELSKTGDLPTQFSERPRTAGEGGSEQEEEEEDDDDIAVTQIPYDDNTSPVQLSPKTPAFNVQKTGSDGRIRTSALKTPATDLNVMFAKTSRQPKLGLSQVFEQTQADSSQPIHLELPSDHLFARPSPDNKSPEVDDPVLTTSSPPIPRKSLRATVEPFASYQPVNESQRKRDQKQKEIQHKVSSLASEDDWDNVRAKQYRSREHRARALRHLGVLDVPDYSPKTTKRKREYASDTGVDELSVKRRSPRKSAIYISSDRQSRPDSSDLESLEGDDGFGGSVLNSNPRNQIGAHQVNRSTPSSLFRKNSPFQRPNSSPLPAKSSRVKGLSPERSAHVRHSSSLGPKEPSDADELSELKHTVDVANSQPDEEQVRIARTENVSQLSSPELRYNSRDFVSQSQTLPPKHSTASAPSRDSNANGVPSEASSQQVHIIHSDKSSRGVPQKKTETRTGQSTSTYLLDPHSDTHEAILGTQNPSQSGRSGRRTVTRQEAPQITSSNQDGSSAPVVNELVPQTSPLVVESAIGHSDSPHRLSTTRQGRNSSEASSIPSRDRRPVKASEPQMTESYKTAPSHSSSMGAPQTSLADPKLSSHGGGVVANSSSQHAIRSMMDFVVASPDSTPQELNVDSLNILNADDLRFQQVVQDSPGSAMLVSKGLKPYGKPATPGTKSKQNKASRRKVSINLEGQIEEDDKEKGNGDTLSEYLKRRNPRKARSSQAGPEAGLQCPSREYLDPNSTSKDSPSQHPGSNLEIEHLDHDHAEQQDVFVNREDDLRDSSQLNPSSDEISNSHRIWAYFRGLRGAFYPATSLDNVTTTDSDQLVRVAFDDGAEDVIARHLVSPLDLRSGDSVKVDLPGMRKNTYAIRGFSDRFTSEQIQSNPSGKYLSDVRGYATVCVEVKQRQSLPNSENNPPSTNVPVSSLYITSTMWPQFEGRSGKNWGKVSTYKGNHLPPSRDLSSAQLKVSSHVPGQISTTGVSTSPIHVVDSIGRRGIFAGMVFVVSFGSQNEDLKAQVCRNISDNGGLVLADGFDELFDSTQPIAMSPLLPTAGQQTFAVAVKEVFVKTTFVALIADVYSRRAKYLQALALNIPCVSGQWVNACVSSQALVPASHYLLPAGESAMLDNVVKSRVFDGDCLQSLLYPSKAQLKQNFESRPRVLKDQKVIFVHGKSKTDERRTPFNFLIRAAGPSEFTVVKDLASAQVLLAEDNSWNLVLVDDQKVGNARQQLRNFRQAIKSRKSRPSKDGNQGLGKIIVLGDEDVVQSLIFGALLDASKQSLITT